MIRYFFFSIIISSFVFVFSDFPYNFEVCPTNICYQKISANEFYIYNATKITSLIPIKQQVPKAEVIKIRKCNLMTLNKEDLNFKDLKTLHIVSNRLSTLKENTLSYLTALEEVDFSYNQVHSISGKLFSGVLNLKLINLKNNSIGELPTNLFTNLTKLQHIDLSCNELIVIEEHTFQDNLDLICVKLMNNHIKRFALHLPSIHFLDLSMNQLEDLKVKNVNYLYVNQCLLKTLNISGSCFVLEANNNELEHITIDDQKSMISIRLSNNVLKNISNFDDMGTLEILDISNNFLSHDGFIGNVFKSLKILNLKNFFIDTVDIREQFSEYDSLQSLVISISQTELSLSKMLPLLRSLKELTAYGENIRSISRDDDLKSIFPNLERFILKNHKLNYNQRVILKNQLAKLNIEFIDLDDEQHHNSRYNGIFDQIDNLNELTETTNSSNKYLLITILMVLLLILLMNAMTVLNFNIYSFARDRFSNIDHSLHNSTVSFIYNDESQI
ncbi:hypothetical protein ACFFRR_009341 [Megaselia abdita]